MRHRKGGFTLVELMVVIAIIALLATVGIGVAQYAISKSRITACGDHLKKLGEAAGVYQQEQNIYPKYAGGAFWKALYVDTVMKQREVGQDSDMYLCPNTDDTNRDATGVIWETAQDPSTVTASECSYAGPITTTGKIKASDALGSDDAEPDTTIDGQNHNGWGVNVLKPNYTVEFFDNPDTTTPLFPGAGGSQSKPEFLILETLQN